MNTRTWHALVVAGSLLALAPSLVKAAGSEGAAPAVGEAVELKFNAFGGGKVDLAELKGKVVLIDFWATWCGPCVREVPNVVAAYEKLHAKGFEIVGISLDSERGDLRRFLRENKMSWPQYFDGKGWKNEISTRFGIRSIPTMWLVGKDGKLASTNARHNLEASVEELLTRQ